MTEETLPDRPLSLVVVGNSLTFVQVPVDPARLQDRQAPGQEFSQQTPFSQAAPTWHSSPGPLQDSPTRRGAMHCCAPSKKMHSRPTWQNVVD